MPLSRDEAYGIDVQARDRHLTLLKHVLPHLSALRSLDLREDVGTGLTHCIISSPVTKFQVCFRVITSSDDAQSQRRKTDCLSPCLTLLPMIHLHPSYWFNRSVDVDGEASSQ